MSKRKQSPSEFWKMIDRMNEEDANMSLAFKIWACAYIPIFVTHLVSEPGTKFFSGLTYAVCIGMAPLIGFIAVGLKQLYDLRD